MTENKRFTVKQRQGATIYSIKDYYGELPLNEGMYYKSNAEKLCKWLNTQHDLLNAFYNENEQLKQFKSKVFNLLQDEIREESELLDYYLKEKAPRNADRQQIIIGVLKRLQKELQK